MIRIAGFVEVCQMTGSACPGRPGKAAVCVAKNAGRLQVDAGQYEAGLAVIEHGAGPLDCRVT